MVYRGRPSKGCQKCRQRRIRCDQQPLPIGCKPCSRAGVPCPGYPDELDQMFCHQTEHTVHKAEKNRKKQATAVAAEDHPAVASDEQHAVSSVRKPPHPVGRKSFLQPNVDDFALAYCYEHHIAVARPTNGGDSLTSNEADLLTCMRALGMASYAATAKSQESTIRARQYYGAAISAINSALATPKKATKDSTLLSIISMSYFESILGDDKSGVAAWANHIDGTAMLIKLRGREQLRTETGRILFMQASSNMISQCMRLKRRLPIFIHEMWQEAAKYCTDFTDPIWQVHSAMFELVDFWSDAGNGRLLDAKQAITMSLRLDATFAGIFVDPAEKWRYHTREISVPIGEKPRTPGYVHIYHDTLASQVWNAMRNGRMVCNAIIMGTIRKIAEYIPLTADHLTLLSQSQAIITEMSNDVLATVQQHIGLDETTQKSNPSQPDEVNPQQATPRFGSKRKVAKSGEMSVSSMLNYDEAKIPILKTSQGFLLVWCLTVVGKLNDPGSQLRVEACKSMRLIGHSLGIRQALFLAWFLEHDLEIEP